LVSELKQTRLPVDGLQVELEPVSGLPPIIVNLMGGILHAA
jgi:hypothetical protein